MGGRNGGRGRGGWEVRGGLYFPTGLFGVAIYESKNCTSHRPIDKPGGPKRCLTNTGEYQTHTSHLVPFMGPIVSVVTSHGRQNPL